MPTANRCDQGIDMSGTIEAMAADVTSFNIEDQVYGMTGGIAGVPGSLAEYAVVDARLIARRPGAWTARQAAAVPLAAITAWEGLVDRADLQGPSITISWQFDATSS